MAALVLPLSEPQKHGQHQQRLRCRLVELHHTAAMQVKCIFFIKLTTAMQLKHYWYAAVIGRQIGLSQPLRAALLHLGPEALSSSCTGARAFVAFVESNDNDRRTLHSP